MHIVLLAYSLEELHRKTISAGPKSCPTLAFHPTGSGSSCGSLFGSAAPGAHYHHQTNCDLRGASGAMAYLKSNPYAMNGIAGITSGDLLHPSVGYPGECCETLDGARASRAARLLCACMCGLQLCCESGA